MDPERPPAPPGAAPRAPRHGARHLGDDRTRFSVWAPAAEEVVLVLEDGRTPALGTAGDGWHRAVVDRAGPGTRHRYLLDGDGPLADPASRSQPDGVHGPSAVVDPAAWPPAVPGWRGLPLAAQVICELHVGTFTADGTFDAAVEELGFLAGAGYTAIELMPVAEFPGTRNWGYDGVFPFAAQSSYGGPEGLARFVARAHELGLAVILDVVYNHLGPEGAVLHRFGPYFTDAYRTPWGEALEFAGPHSDVVRGFFTENALWWTRDLGIDGLRLDAVHAIVDPTATPFVAELARAVRSEGRRAGRTVTVVAESTDNDPRLVRDAGAGGLGLDGQWDDDFHHALRTSLPCERDGHLADYDGVADLAKAFEEGFVLDGRWSSFRCRRHGASGRGIAGERLVVFAQNHDQVGNAGHGVRLAASLPVEAQWPVSAAVVLSPFVPLRFMGEEYGETAPFPYFTSHGDPDLVEAVRRGRADEVGEADVTDPQAVATFESARPDRRLAGSGVHAELLEWNRRLLALRRDHAALGSLDPALSTAHAQEETGSLVVLRRPAAGVPAPAVVVVLQLRGTPARFTSPLLDGRSFEVLASYRAPGLEAGGGWAGASPLDLDGWAVVVLAETGW